MEVTSYLLGKKQGGGGSEPTGTIDITSNGSHNVKSYATANVNVPTVITPTGTINITENGTSDVTNYASASVNVQPDLETKSITITENTTTTITPTQGKDGLSSVEVTTNVSGGGTPETLEELTIIYTSFVNFTNDIPNNYEAQTSEAKTLYTPSETFRNYVIFKDTSNKYKIAWCYSGEENYNYATGIKISKSSSNYYVTGDRINLNMGRFIHENYTNRYYSNTTYNTLEDCLQAIQSNSITYTINSSNSSYKMYNKNSVILSNAYVYIEEDDENINVQRISSNETIEVISS